MERVRLVIAWYSRAIHLERRAEPTDRKRLDELVSQRQACVADQRALDDADDIDIARMAADYGARYRRLTHAEKGS